MREREKIGTLCKYTALAEQKRRFPLRALYAYTSSMTPASSFTGRHESRDNNNATSPP